MCHAFLKKISESSGSHPRRRSCGYRKRAHDRRIRDKGYHPLRSGRHSLCREKTRHESLQGGYRKGDEPRKVKGSLFDALKGAHIFIGLAGPNTVTTDHIRSMAKEPIVFVLANPDPEIAPEAALPLVRILATGRLITRIR